MSIRLCGNAIIAHAEEKVKYFLIKNKKAPELGGFFYYFRVIIDSSHIGGAS